MALVGSFACAALLLVRPAAAAGADCTAPVSNWTGMQLDGAHTSISAQWTVPTARCSATRDGMIDQWIGFGSGDSWKDPLNQTGTSAACENGVASYWAWWEQYPADPVNYSDPVRAGDVMTSSITAPEGSQNYTMTLRNVTRHWSRTVAVTGPDTGTQVEVITELHTPTALSTTITYDKVLVDGKPLADFPAAQIMSGQYGGVCVNATVDDDSLITAPQLATSKSRTPAVIRPGHPG